jgi:hypothetical protein
MIVELGPENRVGVSQKTKPSKTWQGLPRIKDVWAREAFDSLIKIQV